MIFFNNFSESLVIIYLYMFVYNISFMIIFWTFQTILNTKLKTIFSFKDFKLNFFNLSLIVIALFSLAGVPPFVGFFPKLLILINLLNSSFFFFYIFFFALMLVSLYFYFQNMKFLLSNTNTRTSTSYFNNFRLPKIYLNTAIIIFFFFMLGFIFFDDLILYFFWIFS